MVLTHDRSIKEVEARIGLNFKGFSRSHAVQARQPYAPCIADLLDGINDINTRYVSYNISAIRKSNGIRRKADELFHKLGAELWPNDETDSSPSWLLSPYNEDDPPVNAYHYRYSKKLRYSDPIDCAV